MRTHALTLAQTLAQTHAQTLAQTHAQTLAQTLAQTQTLTLAQTQALTLAQTQALTLTQTHAHTGANILAVVEGRDSSEINQAFDRFVAKAGKRRATLTLDTIRRSHITPVIDSWMLVLVGLQILRDCNSSDVWENSFLAVNMHP